jgi:hypothetical protein
MEPATCVAGSIRARAWRVMTRPQTRGSRQVLAWTGSPATPFWRRDGEIGTLVALGRGMAQLTQTLPTRPMMLRRVMIICPVTQSPSDTGFELTTLPELGFGRQLLIDCLECGQDHEWRVAEAILE